MRITRRFEFDSAHRLLNHESKCRFIHGHRYVAEVTVEAPELDSLGRVIDFGELKQLVGEWIDENWDHNILLNSDDPLLALNRLTFFEGREPFVFSKTNPTVEVMVKHLFLTVAGILISPLKVIAIRLYETPNCWADYSG